jgi:hypothetical protein
MPGRGERIFPLASVSRPALGPTQLPVGWVPRVFSPGLKRGRGVTLTTHPHLVPRSRMSRSYTSLLPSAFMACSGTALALITLSSCLYHVYRIIACAYMLLERVGARCICREGDDLPTFCYCFYHLSSSLVILF